jgi:hypothetical protein
MFKKVFELITLKRLWTVVARAASTTDVPVEAEALKWLKSGSLRGGRASRGEHRGSLDRLGALRASRLGTRRTAGLRSAGSQAGDQSRMV